MPQPTNRDRELVPIKLSATFLIVFFWEVFLTGGLLVVKAMDAIDPLGCPDSNPYCYVPTFYWWKVAVGWIAGNIVLAVVLAIRRGLRKRRARSEAAEPGAAG